MTQNHPYDFAEAQKKSWKKESNMGNVVIYKKCHVLLFSTCYENLAWKGLKICICFCKVQRWELWGKGAVLLLKAFNTFVPSAFSCISTQCEFSFQMWEFCWEMELSSQNASPWIYCPGESFLDVMIGLNCQIPAQWLWQCVPANPYLPKLLRTVSRIFKPKGLMEQGNKDFHLSLPPVLLPNYHSFSLP